MRNLRGIGMILSICGGAWAQSGWVPQASGTTKNLHAVRFVDADTGWVVGDSGALLKTTNGGATWSPKPSTTSQALRALHFLDAAQGWAVGDSGVLLHTSDGGETWQARASGVTTGLRAVRFVGMDSGWIGGDSGVLLRTLNGGDSWTQVGIDTISTRVNALAFKRGGLGYAATGTDLTGRLFRTADGGVSWTEEVRPGGYEWRDVVFAGDSLMGLNGRFIQLNGGLPAWDISIRDSGGTWSATSGHSIGTPRSLHFIHSGMGWTVGLAGRILRWTPADGWLLQTSSTNAALHSVYFVDEFTGWAVGGGGVILKAENGGVSVLGSRNNSSAIYTLSGNRFSYRLTSNAAVRITLSRLDGTRATVLVDRVMPPGSHSLALAGRVPAGLYLLEYRSGAENRRFRAMIQ